MDAIIWGAGRGLETIKQLKEIKNYNIKAVVDSDETKWGNSIKVLDQELSIVAPDDIKNYAVECIILSVLVREIQYDIVNQLSQLNIKKKVLILSMARDKLIPFPEIKGEYKRIGNNATVFSDVSVIAVTDYKSGIQRVVNSIHNNISDLVSVQWINGRYYTAVNYDCYVKNKEFNNVEYLVTPNANEKVIMIDLDCDRIVEKIHYLKKKNVKIYVVVYDLIPIRHRDMCFKKDFYQIFKIWIDTVLQYADCILCISNTVADDVKDYYEERHITREKPLQIYTFPMGYDIKKSINTITHVRDELKNFVNKDNTFLTVGTVEIRKNHFLLLKAWRKLLDEGFEGHLLILGHDGWENQDFKELYYNTIKETDSVLWIDDATDEEVSWAYGNSRALVFPSKFEGYGLPLIEAASYGLPILCSDIPIFREIAGEAVTYFKVDDIKSLLDAVMSFGSSNMNPDSRKIKLYSWKDSAQEVAAIINDRVVPKYVLQ